MNCQRLNGPRWLGLGLLVFAASVHADIDTLVVTAPATTALDAVVSLDKTGTPVVDVPRSIQVVPRSLIDEQGATQLKDVLGNASGLTQGGQFAFGFFDRIIIRGLNASYLNDGLPDGTSDLTGYVHSLTGIERVEILKGPGSALYGSAEPGGTINLVHFRPSATPSATIREQYSSYDTTTTDVSLNGPTGIANLDGRIDGEYQHSNGFRGTRNETGEIYGSLDFHPTNHDVLFRYEYHRLEDVPDAVGVPFSPPAGTGQPLNVPRDDRYYSPFAFADQEVKRAFLSDAWTVADFLMVNLQTAYGDREVDLLRNAGGRLTAAGGTYSLTGRQIRAQDDHIHDFVAQAEPTWKFKTGSIAHTLVTGADAHLIASRTERSTADLPNILNVFDPVVPETSLAALTFKCDAAHSCDDDELNARFYGLYAIDQIDLSKRLKLRLSARQDWFETSAAGLSVVPANPGSERPCVPLQATECPLVPGDPIERRDSVFSWDVGAVYFLTDALSVFSGYSSTIYPIFNTEEPESIGQVPEKGTQVEAGLRFQHGSWLSLTSALFRTTRLNVFTILTVPDPNGLGVLDEPQVFSYQIKGWETDVNLRPTTNWNVIANFTRQDSRIIGFPQTPADLGNRIPSVPSMLANLWTTYDIAVPGPIDRLQLALGAHTRNRQYADAGETRIVPGTTLLELAFAIPHDRWTFRAGVENLLDRFNYVFAAGTGGGALPGQGRTFFASVSVKVF